MDPQNEKIKEFNLKKFNKKTFNFRFLEHPYNILLSYLKKGDKDDNYEFLLLDNKRIDDYFQMLDDYNRFGISFSRKDDLFPNNKLYVEKDESEDEVRYFLTYNDFKITGSSYLRKITLDDYVKGEKSLTKKEKQKREFIKKQTNKKLQIIMMNPDFYEYDKLFFKIIELFDRKINRKKSFDRKLLLIKELLEEKLEICKTYFMIICLNDILHIKNLDYLYLHLSHFPKILLFSIGKVKKSDNNFIGDGDKDGDSDSDSNGDGDSDSDSDSDSNEEDTKK